MSLIVNLSDKVVLEAKVESKKAQRSLPGQLEYWMEIGRLAQENPELNYRDLSLIIENEEGYDCEILPFVFLKSNL